MEIYFYLSEYVVTEKLKKARIILYTDSLIWIKKGECCSLLTSYKILKLFFTIYIAV